MQTKMRVAVMVASLGLMSAAHANNLQNPKAAPASSATTTTTATTTTPSGSQASTTDQVLVGGTSSAPSQTGTSQDTLGQHDHGHDEDMD